MLSSKLLDLYINAPRHSTRPANSTWLRKLSFFAPLAIFGAAITLWPRTKKAMLNFFVQHGLEELEIKN